MILPDEELKKILLKVNAIPEQDLANAELYAKNSNSSLADSLIERNILSDEVLGVLLADYFKFPFVALTKISIPEDVFRIVPERVARKYKLIAFAKDQDGVKLAMSDPNLIDVANLIAKKTGKQVYRYFATERDIYNALQVYRKDPQIALGGLFSNDLDEKTNKLVRETPVAKIVDAIIEYAYHDKASDIHIEPEENRTLIRFRLDGILHDILNLPKHYHTEIINRIKVLSRLRTDEHYAPQDDVKVGRDETENEVVKTVGEKKEFNFKVKDHVELGEILGVIDIERAAKVSGARFAYLKNEAVLLQFALYQYAMEILIAEKFIPVVPPVIINTDVMRCLGYTENGGGEDMFHLRDNDKVLVGTAEHALVPMHKDEVLDGKKLPLRYFGISSSFRREAGSYGKDTKGIFRVHQFDKVEMVSFVRDGEDDKEQEFLLSIEEKLFQGLEIPYQVVKMCTGDLGFPAARKFDIEAWIPSQQKYREVTSVSTVTDFQSRRLNIKYQKDGGKEFVNVLNGTAFAIGRTIIAILENYQAEDGSVTVPEVLRKYVGMDKILPKK